MDSRLLRAIGTPRIQQHAGELVKLSLRALDDLRQLDEASERLDFCQIDERGFLRRPDRRRTRAARFARARGAGSCRPVVRPLPTFVRTDRRRAPISTTSARTTFVSGSTSFATKRYAPGKGKSTKRKGPKEWAYSKSTVRGYYRVLRTILVAAGAEDACRTVGKLKLAPIGEVAHKAEPKHGNYLTRDELRVVLANIEKHAPQWYAAVLLDVFVGLRWGELSALRWSDIDEQREVIRVERGNYEGRVVGSTKTGNDEDPNAKVVPLLPEIAEVLRARRQQMVTAQHPGLVEGWVFPTEKGKLYKGHPLRRCSRMRSMLARSSAA